MGMFDIPADESLHQALAGNSSIGEPAVLGAPTPQTHTEAPPAQAQPEVQPVTKSDFDLLARSITELSKIVARQAAAPAPQPVMAPPVQKPAHVEMLERLAASDDPEKAAMAAASLEAHRQAMAENQQLRSRLDETVNGYQSRIEIDEQKSLDREIEATSKVYGLVPEEVDRLVTAWEGAVTQDERIAFLTFEEFARRAYGSERLESRRVQATPKPIPPPARPQGQVLTSAATGGGAPEPWSPPHVDGRGKPHTPQLEDARRAAYRRLGIEP